MTKLSISRDKHYYADLIAFFLFFIIGLAISRLVYEAAFPRLLSLAHFIPSLLLALVIAGGAWIVWRWTVNRLQWTEGDSAARSSAVWVLIPLLINLTYLFDATVDLANSRLYFAASIWLAALLFADFVVSDRNWSWLGMIFVLAALVPIYLATIPKTVGSADTFEFQVVIPQMGIAHPTGYPLYLLLGRLFTFIPVGSMAWRVNLASTIFASLAVLFVFAAARQLTKRAVPAVLAAVMSGMIPVYWSQAIEAEVYALHALLVAIVIWTMTKILTGHRLLADCSSALFEKPMRVNWERGIILLAFLIGLGLANHLTTLFLLPPALLTIFFAYRVRLRQLPLKALGWLLIKVGAAFLFPLFLYAYLPIRWFALHEEAMGLERFVRWVIGGRFQGALQLSAWLEDMTRYQVTGRLLLQNWGWINLLLILLGLLNLLQSNWRAAVVLCVTWLGFMFYALNYYVPDLAVFIIPAHMVMAIFWGAGIAKVATLGRWLANKQNWPALQSPLTNILILIVLLPSLNRLGDTWTEMANKENSELLNWGKGVLAMPLDSGAAILADSEKIAPLYYLQQAEGIRPDLDIMVLPDEAAYRAELDARLRAGQTVYLARYLPGLEGIYHLRSVGPLIEVSQEPLLAAPAGITEMNFDFGTMHLIGAVVNMPSSFDAAAADATLYWQTATPTIAPTMIYLRWIEDGLATDAFVRSGQHPVNNSYPTAAWEIGEIVADFHLLPLPIIATEQELELQVAVGPSFQPAEELSWTTIASILVPPTNQYEATNPLRAQNGRVLLSAVQFPAEIRSQTPLPVILSGYGSHVQELQLELQPVEEELAGPAGLRQPDQSSRSNSQFTYATQVGTDLPNGHYYLVSQDPQMGSTCGWWARLTSGCVLGEIAISGVALPAEAVNYDQKIALLDFDLPQRQLQPGGQLALNLRWQSLSSMEEDYTVFIQLLDAQDRIIGQIDAWPLQGTYPTSQWKAGEIVEDPYLLPLPENMPAGSYKLHIGWYLLSTLQRLPVVDENGLPVDDKIVINDLAVP